MLIFWGRVLFKILTLKEQVTITNSFFNTPDWFIGVVFPVLDMCLLAIFLKGLIISYKKDFIKAFPYNKELSYIKILTMILIISGLILLRQIDFDFSRDVSPNKYPPILSTK